MSHRTGPLAFLPPALMAFTALAGACSGGSSNSQVTRPNDTGGGQNDAAGSSSGGSGGSGGGGSGSVGDSAGGGSSGGSSASSGAPGGSSGVPGASSGGPGASSGGGSIDGGDAGSCPHTTSLIQGVNVTMPVIWPATSSVNQGLGSVHLWLLATLSVAESSGNLTLSGKIQTCATALPPLSLNGAGQIVTGGTKVQVAFPASVWTAPSMPKFDVTGTATGWDPGSSIRFDPVLAPIGVTLADPTAPWPTSSWGFPSGTPFVDADGDGHPGITAAPISGNGYVLPPTGLGVFGSAPAADKLYIVTRNEISLSGARTSCTDAAGTTSVTYFDNHVVGCHVLNGSDCTTGSVNTQADFVDGTRTVYTVGSATFAAKELAATATCADVLTALP